MDPAKNLEEGKRKKYRQVREKILIFGRGEGGVQWPKCASTGCTS